MRTMFWRAALLLLLCPAAAPAEVPFDLRGGCPVPELAWRLPGAVPGATVVGFETETGPLLLVAGSRDGAAPSRLGDLAVVSPQGWAVRRIVAPGGIIGRPAMLRRVVLAGDGQGSFHAWPLGGQGQELSPWTVASRGPFTIGPIVVGATFVFAAGTQVASVSDLVEPRWQVDLGAPVIRPLASDGPAIYAATESRLIALAAADGEPIWSGELDSPLETGLLVTAGLVVGGFADGSLRAFDAGSGEEVWRRPIATAPFAADLALAGPWLFAAAGEQVQAVTALEGEPVWAATVPAPAGSPILGFGQVFVTGGDGRLHGLPLDAEQAPWAFAATADTGAETPLVGAVSIHGRRLYVTGADGSLLALDVPTATGPAPWPVPGGTAARNGRIVVELEE